MKKWALFFSFITTFCFAQQPVEITYDGVNQAFQAQLSQLFQSFVAQQKAQGNEVVVTFYDNQGEVRVTQGSASAPSYLKAISAYKVDFLRTRQLFSTQGVIYFGVIANFP